ncbi:sensor domain-containing protein [Dethiosulfatarculus sandiegensis]|uniref:Diguanylate cyclase n=1 Tax=Dethiosulfatarculus sandiegensis TaxID=1429043 RepID=A0A0D2J5I0_9BACT|nr:EAL domain-containing protein [Dethiosulfatarculus sandiegensis]KIX10946.1 diguanylate cyclase [Dethiosulfatarculus sandiegensis]
MLNFYRRLDLSEKHLLVTLAFVIPLAVLAALMDLDFMYDLNIARQEKLGNAFLKSLAPLYQKAPLMHLALTKLDSKGAWPRNSVEAMESDLAVLPKALTRLEKDLWFIPKGREAKRQLGEDIRLLTDQWENIKAGERTPAALLVYMDRLRSMTGDLGDAALLFLDPAPDSNHLARIINQSLPEYVYLLCSLNQALSTWIMPGAKSSLAGQQWFFISNRLSKVAYSSVLKNSERLLRVDPHYYDRSPGLQREYKKALKEFVAQNLAFFKSLEQLQKRPEKEEIKGYLSAWIKAHAKAVRLMEVGSAELETLLDKKIEFYSFRRISGILSGALALGLALLLVFLVRRDLSNSFKALASYTHAVSKGNLTATPPVLHGSELISLAGDTSSMVEKLKNRLAFGQGILNSIETPFLVVDQKGRITFINHAMPRIFGDEKDLTRYRGRSLDKVWPSESKLNRMVQDCLESRSCTKYNRVELNTKSGQRVLSMTLSPLFDLDDRLIGASVSAFDLTDLLAKEKSLEQKNLEIGRLATFPRENPSPILSVDAKGESVCLNPATIRVLHDSPEDLPLFLPADHLEVVKNCLASGRGRENMETEYRNRVWSWIYNPLPELGLVHLYAYDITERKRMEEQLLYDAMHDYLTGLPNRAMLLERLNRALEEKTRHPEYGFAVLCVDLDRFKDVNDSLGHSLGDEVLKIMGRRIQKVLRPYDTLSRFGGDEFTVLLERLESAQEAVSVGELIHEEIARPIRIRGYELFASVSIGILLPDSRHNQAEVILRDADTAMYRAKALGKARSEVFEAKMHQKARNRLMVESELKLGLEDGQVIPYFQPLVDMKSGYIAGFEALARWRHPVHGILGPGYFIEIAEETGLINPLGLTMLEQACLAGRKWKALAQNKQGLLMSVNLSVRQFASPTLLEDIAEILAKTGYPPHLIKLEVTESGIMANAEASVKLLNSLANMGLKLSIDDFGTGYSSLSYLHRFPFDSLKVDQCFVGRMQEKEENKKIVQTIVGLAHDMAKEVIAEGIETKAQFEILRDMKCEYGQGFLFARPLPAKEAEDLLVQSPRW